MLYYALMFLVLGLVAAALGLSGIAGVATQISWVLFVVGIVLLIIHAVSGRSTERDLERFGWSPRSHRGGVPALPMCALTPFVPRSFAPGTSFPPLPKRSQHQNKLPRYSPTSAFLFLSHSRHCRSEIRHWARDTCMSLGGIHSPTPSPNSTCTFRKGLAILSRS
ncbi:MAG: DUF1328 family protein [Nitrospirales bacterium]